jgi:hypothetical protein
MEFDGVRRALRRLGTPDGGFDDLLDKLDKAEAATLAARGKYRRKEAPNPARSRRRSAA